MFTAYNFIYTIYMYIVLTDLMSPPFKSPVRKTLVAETPSHKQKNSAMWKRQEAERRRSQSNTSVKVVEESPLKSGKQIMK